MKIGIRFDTVLIWLISAMLMLYAIQDAGASPVGCEQFNATVYKCWNEGSIENTTFISSDASQMANRDPSRFEWATYEMGVFWRVPTFTKIPIDFSSASINVSSDNLSYWRITWNQTMQQGGKIVDLSYTLKQKQYDDYVNATITFHTVAGFQAFSKNISVYRMMKKINISLDNFQDIVNFENDGMLVNFPTSDTGTKWYGNVSGDEIRIGQMETTDGISWHWDPKHYQAVWKNQKLGFFREFSPSPSGFGNNKTKSITHYWIDVPTCIITSPAGCELAEKLMYFPNGKDDVDGLIEAYFRARYTCNSFFGCAGILFGRECNSAMTFNSGCYFVAMDNTTTKFFGINIYTEMNFTPQVNPYVMCDKRTYAQCRQNEMGGTWGKGNTSHFNISCQSENWVKVAGCFVTGRASVCPAQQNPFQTYPNTFQHIINCTDTPPVPVVPVASKEVLRCPLHEWFWCWTSRPWWEVFK